MVNLVTEHKITPKKKPIRPWGYNKVQRGKIHNFKFPDSKNAMNRMEEEVTNPLRWNRYAGPNPEGKGSRSYTRIKIVPEIPNMRVFCLFFPDGRVWDSHLRKFRKIKDYEQRSR